MVSCFLHHTKNKKNNKRNWKGLFSFPDKIRIRQLYLSPGFILIILAIILLTNCRSVPDQKDVVFDSKKTLHEIWRIVYNTPLSLEKAPAYTGCLKKYFLYYNLDIEGSSHYFGSFRSGDYLVAAHIFMPRFAIETVYLVHGYLMHSGYYNHFIKFLFEHNFAVAVFDLPGHGFSSGDLVDIHYFSDYAKVLHDFINYTKDTFIPPPFAIVGHDLGGAIVIDYLLTYESMFQHHILSAPLIRSKMWGFSTTGVTLFKGGIESIPAHIGDITSDAEYTEFLQNREPLRRDSIPLSWIDKFIEWNKKLDSLDIINEKEILLFQGNLDIIADWKYNINLITHIFPHTDVYNRRCKT